MTRLVDSFGGVISGKRSPFQVWRRTHDPEHDIQLMALIWATWNLSAPSDMTQLVSSFTIKGYNWSVWQQALTQRITARGGDPNTEIVHSGSLVQFTGEAVLDLASMFELVVLGHWWPPAFITEVKQRSKVGTQVLLWNDFESINQKKPFGPTNQVPWTELYNWPISADGNTQNVYGCRTIDKFETSPRAAGQVACHHVPTESSLPTEASISTSHTWDIDIYAATENGLPNSDTAELTVFNMTNSVFTAGYTASLVPGHMFDNLLISPFKGAASNSYRTGWTADYIQGWKAFLQTWKDFIAWPDTEMSIWGNGPVAVTTYSKADCRGRYVEHFFRTGTSPKPFTTIRSELESVAANQTHLVLGARGTIGQTHLWASTFGGTDATWRDVVGVIRSLGIVDNIYVAAWQTFNDAYIYHQNGFRVPV